MIHAAPELGGEEVAGLANLLARARLEQAEAPGRGPAVIGHEHDRLHEPVIGDAGLLVRAFPLHTGRDEPIAADVITLEGSLLETLRGHGVCPASRIGVVDVVPIGRRDVGDPIPGRGAREAAPGLLDRCR